MRVLAAMSGGVDSSVAAARMVDAGHDVVGVHLALSQAPGTLRTGSRGCCSKEDAGDARRVADVLGIPFYVWDFADRFKEDVIDDFVSSYARGETPNPCVRCNERIKFSALAARALVLGFDAVATGHYARLSGGQLRRAVDAEKDQSYVLAVLTSDQLRHAAFPIGDTPKSQIRDEAARREMTLREALAFLIQREVARKDERRIEMASKIAHFPTLRDLDSFDFAAQPSLDKTQIRELAACRWVAHGDAFRTNVNLSSLNFYGIEVTAFCRHSFSSLAFQSFAVPVS